MTAPPDPRSASNGITGTHPNAETKRHAERGIRKAVSSKVIRAMKAAGMQPQGFQVRSLTTTLLANHDVPSEEDVTRALMAAPWFPKPRRRRWQVGEGGGWGVRS